MKWSSEIGVETSPFRDNLCESILRKELSNDNEPFMSDENSMI